MLGYVMRYLSRHCRVSFRHTSGKHLIRGQSREAVRSLASQRRKSQGICAVHAIFCCASFQSAGINAIGPRGTQRGKCAVAAVGRAAAVGRYDPEMIRRAGSQAADLAAMF
jgi:hypothetical protein